LAFPRKITPNNISQTDSGASQEDKDKDTDVKVVEAVAGAEIPKSVEKNGDDARANMFKTKLIKYILPIINDVKSKKDSIFKTIKQIASAGIK